MRFAQFLLILSLLVILFMVINVSFGASSDKLENYKGSFSSNYYKKISSLIKFLKLTIIILKNILKLILKKIIKINIK